MMGKDPAWLRQDNAGLRQPAEIEFVIDPQMAVRDGLRLLETRPGSLETREPADIEFVIDPQMAVRDGLRLLETRSGSLETHDWVSNKCFVYAYHRGSSEPMWMNQAFRLRIDKAMG